MKINLFALLESSELKDLFLAVVGKESIFEYSSAIVAKNYRSENSLKIYSNEIGGETISKWTKTKDPNNYRNELAQLKEVCKSRLNIRIEITESGLMNVSCLGDSLATPYSIYNVFEVARILERFRI